jgi:hypothetical protein
MGDVDYEHRAALKASGIAYPTEEHQETAIRKIEEFVIQKQMEQATAATAVM